MRYLVGQSVSDPFFYLEKNGTKKVWLSALDRGAFAESNQDSALSVESLELLLQKACKHPNTITGLACAILETEVEEGNEVLISKHFPLDVYQDLTKVGFSLVVARQLAPERITKQEHEVIALKQAQTATRDAFAYIESVLQGAKIDHDVLTRDGLVLTSEQLKKEVELQLFKAGYLCSEGIIISCGADAAMPHHQGSGPLCPHQTIICDIFPQDRTLGYFGDMTRTYVKGEPTNEVLKMYETVLRAQQAALAALRPGVSVRSVYEISKEIIAAEGYVVGPGEEGYMHSLGHGVGLDVHEKPALSPRSDEILRPGMVVTVEPGLYYEAHGGVRIEDMVVITDSGHANLTDHPYQLTVM